MLNITDLGRGKMRKHRIVALLFMLLAVAGCLSSCTSKSVPKAFEYEGMKIILTSSFGEEEVEGPDKSFVSDKMAVFVIREGFDLVEGFGDYDIDGYTQLCLEANDMVGKEVKKLNGIPYFEFESDVDGEPYTYVAFTYKGTDAFWLIQFVTASGDTEKMRSEIETYASSVTFS